LLGKHFALLGSTGTGKSTAAALILHKICDLAPQGHIIMIDPHGEYGAAFKHNGKVFDVNNLNLPYWLMNFREHCEVFVQSRGDAKQMDCDILAKCLLAAKAKSQASAGVAKLTVDSPVPYLLSDLTTILQNEMGKLDKATNSAPYQRLKSKIDEIKADPRYSFMFSGMLVGDTMANFLTKIFRLPSEGKPISIIDVSAMPSEITPTVVSVLSRLVFDYAIWARNEPQRPMLLVCEEAHRYIPNDDVAEESAVRDILSRIAKEGRKYGVSLGLITQRPSDLAEGVLSQCGTILSMRLNNDRDQAFVKAAMPEGARISRFHSRLAQPRGDLLRRRCGHSDPRFSRYAGRRTPSGVGRSDLLGSVARTGGRGRNRPAGDQALARPGPVIADLTVCPFSSAVDRSPLPKFSTYDYICSH